VSFSFAAAGDYFLVRHTQSLCQKLKVRLVAAWVIAFWRVSLSGNYKTLHCLHYYALQLDDDHHYKFGQKQFTIHQITIYQLKHETMCI